MLPSFCLSFPSFYLSLYLSLSPSLPPSQQGKCFYCLNEKLVTSADCRTGCERCVRLDWLRDWFGDCLMVWAFYRLWFVVYDWLNGWPSVRLADSPTG